MSGDRPQPRTGDHRSYDELAVGWALHALEPDDEATFTRHLPGCERCPRTVAETFEVMAALAAEQPEAEPSGDLADRVRAAARETEQVGGPSGRADDAPREAGRAPSPVPLPRDARDVPKRRRLRTLLQATAAAAIIGLGAGDVVQAISLQHAHTDAGHQEQLIDALLGRGSATLAAMTNSSGRQMATVVARDGHVQLIADGLPVNDQQDSTYVLWGMGHGSPVALDTFDVSSDRPELHPIGTAPAAKGGFPAYGISLESGRSAPAAPTDIVATGQQPS